MLREKRRLCKIFHAHIQRLREGFDEAAAAGRTGLVQKNVVDGVIADADAFHILSADVQDTVHLRIEEGGRVIMRDGLHFAVIQLEGRLQQGLAVAGGAGARNPDRMRNPVADLTDCPDGGSDRGTVVSGIEAVEQIAALADQCKLGGRGAGVDSQEGISAVIGQIGCLYSGRGVPLFKGVIFFL